MRTVYLCGPINGCTDAECIDWRQHVKQYLPSWSFSDPMDRDFRGVEGDHTQEIVEGDKADISGVDAVLVNTAGPSWGTAMEVLFAWDAGLPVIVVHPDTPISPWLRYHATVIFHTLRDAMEYLYAMPA